jgi:hypothetical protein
MFDESEQRVVDDVARYGWHLVGVNADLDGPAFAYTIGLVRTLGHPEVIMFGLAIDTMWRILNAIGEQVRGGHSFVAAGLYDDLIERYPCKVVPVAERFHSRYLGFAMWYARYAGAIGDLSAVQCLWPDRAGRFPDEAGCDPSIVALQPRLTEDA